MRANQRPFKTSKGNKYWNPTLFRLNSVQIRPNKNVTRNSAWTPLKKTGSFTHAKYTSYRIGCNLWVINYDSSDPSYRLKLSFKQAKNPVVDNFDMAKTELKKYSIEARENVRFLSTLERHFKEHGNHMVWARFTSRSRLSNGRVLSRIQSKPRFFA